jgi:tetratricopeptide (TPR) repeat protein
MGTNIGNKKNEQNRVVISYAGQDFDKAKRLYEDLKIAGANPWLNKEDILPGQNKENEIKKAIRNSRHFIPLFSCRSIEEVGPMQQELKDALDKQREFPESGIYLIPARLDDCNISDQKLEEIQYVDLFPRWEEGFKKILQAMKIESKKQQVSPPIQANIDKIKSNIENSLVNRELALAPSKLGEQFKGEKEFFVGREEYLNKKIKNAIRSPGSRVTIIGPGGSGKSQLAFKALHQYEKERIFDVVIPIYFDLNLMTLSQFLSNMAEGMDIPVNEFDRYDIEDRKKIVRNALSQRHHPLIYLDNYETISYELNDKLKQPSQSTVDISNFLNNNIPDNTSILLTSRERKNNIREKDPIDLEGLSEKESKELFNGLVAADKLLRNPKSEKIREQIDNLLTKTGGHPLSIELIAKNITSVEELEEISESLGTGDQVDWTAPEERFRSLEACFGYTINKLGNTLQQLLPKLTLFKSPFPISAAVEVFDVNKNNIIDLYNRSLLTRIESDYIYGKIEDPEYLLYNVHPALRNYLQKISDKSSHDLEFEYGEKYSSYYNNLVWNTYSAIGKKDEHLQSLARFNIILGGENNDFDMAVKVTNDQSLKAEILLGLSQILSELGILSKAFEYGKRSLEIHKELNDRVGLASDYMNIGLLLKDSGNYQEALEHYNKALEIHKELNNRVGMAADYLNMGVVLRYLSRFRESLESHKRGLAINKELNIRVGLAKDYMGIALVLNSMGEHNEALDSHNKALEIHKELNNRVGLASDYGNIGIVLDNMGRLEEALDSHNKALEIDEELNDIVGLASDYLNIGIVLDNMGRLEEALKSMHNALTILKEFEKESNYHHPLIEDINSMISKLKGEG